MPSSELEKPKLCAFLDNAVIMIGRTTGWLTVVLVAAIIAQVVLRYGFKSGMSSLEELQWHLYAVIFMIALSYSLVQDAHIRLDLLHQRFSPRLKEWVEVIGIIFLLMPMVVVFFLHGLPFAAKSFSIMERSPAPTGLPYRFIIKSFLPIGIGLLGIAALSRLIRGVHILLTLKRRTRHGR